MIKVVFVDLDGTLIDSFETNFLSYKKAFESFKIAFTRDDFSNKWGLDSRDFIPQIAPWLSELEILQLRKLKSDYFSENLVQSSLNVQLVIFLRQLQTNFKIVLVTTAKRSNALLALKFHGIADLFDEVICGDDVRESKPSPECYLLGLKILNVLPSEAFAIEDSAPGIKAAQLAGISTFKVSPFIEVNINE